VAEGVSEVADALVRAEAGLPPITRGVLHRARRAIVLGPRGGVALSQAPSADGAEVSLSLGLALEVFEGPILPGAGELRAMLVEGLQARALATARDLAARGVSPASEEELLPHAREILAAVHADVSRRMAPPPRRFPRPRFGLAVDGAARTGADDLELRVTVGMGVGPVTIAPTIAVRSGEEDPALLVGGEVAAHLLTKTGLRTPVIDLFLRVDFAVVDNPSTAHQGSAGLRLLLDVI
jgi:hypothetical protein